MIFIIPCPKISEVEISIFSGLNFDFIFLAIFLAKVKAGLGIFV